MKSKKGYILLIIALAGLAFIIFNYTQQANQLVKSRTPKALPSSVAAQKLSKNGTEAKKIFEKSIKATNDKDIKTYVSCLIPKARENSKKQLSKFFKTQDVTNTIISFKVLREDKGHLLAEAKVRSINNEKKQKKYRDNLSTIDVSYTQQKDGDWLIDLTTTVDTQLLKN